MSTWRHKCVMLSAVLALCTMLLASLPPLRIAAAGETVQVWLTTTSGSALSGTRLSAQPNKTFGGLTATNPIINVNEAVTYQTIDGFGGAMTDSSAWLIYNSPQRNAIMNDLFSTAGGGYSVVRVPMGASDFSRSNYTYDDTCCDLSNFSVSHDTGYIIPILQQARSTSGNRVKLIAVPWSAPGWMKIGGTYVGNCNGSSNYLNNTYYAMYADYFRRFVAAYQGSYGLPIYAVAMQNEPHNCNSTYGTMNMEAGDQSNFALQLRTALNNGGYSGVKILAWDHNWYDSYSAAATTYPQAVLSFNNSQALNAINGAAYHCYESPEGSESVQTTFPNPYPSKEVYFTECTGGAWATDQAANLTWETRNLVLGPLRNWARTSLYWNLALDQNAGPRVGGCTNCRGMITVNTSNGTYTKNEDYYVWAHFGKVVQPGAVRIDSTSLGNNNIETVAFRNPDGSKALVALNSNASSTITFQVRWANQAFDYSLPPRSLVSFKWSNSTTTPPTATPGTGSGTISTTTWYSVQNVGNSKCVDVAGAGTANGTSVQQWDCVVVNQQQWLFVPTDSGYYRIMARHAQTQALEIAGGTGATGNGAKTQIWGYVGGTNQQWMPESMGTGVWRLRARHSSRCLDVPGAATTNGLQLQQYDCNSSNAQNWRLIAR